MKQNRKQSNTEQVFKNKFQGVQFDSIFIYITKVYINSAGEGNYEICLTDQMYITEV